jgi:hypothetical protein
MTKPLQWLLGIFLGVGILAMCLAIWGAIGLTQIGYTALENWSKAAPDLQPTLDAISGPRGTLHEVNKSIVKIGDAVVTTQMIERASTSKVNATMDAIATIPGHVNPVLDSARGTLDASTDLTVQLTKDARTANDTISAMQAPIGQFNEAGANLNALLKDRAIHDTLENVQTTTQNVAGITADFQRVTDKASADYLAPKPWWKKTFRFAGDAFDYGAFVARHY